MQIHDIFLSLAIILFSARLIGDLFARFGLPHVLGEIIVGILLGQSVLGIIEVNEIIKILAEIGVILLLFQIGLEADIKRLISVGIAAFMVAFIGALLPMVLGFIVSYYFLGYSLIVSLFIGGTLTATSIGITVGVLESLGKLKERSAQVVLGAAVLDDILGIIVLTALAQIAREGKLNVDALTLLIFYILIFFMFAPFLAKILAKFIEIMSKFLKTLDFVPPTIIAVVFLFAYLASIFHVEAILGAFTVGLALSRRFVLPFALFLKANEDMTDKIEDSIDELVWVLTPVFFVYVGLQLNLKAIDFSNPEFWIASTIIFIVAFLGKVISGFFVTRNVKEALLIGFSMLPRGEVGLIFAEVGRQTGIYDDFLYAVIIFVVALTTLISPIVLRIIAPTLKFQNEA